MTVRKRPDGHWQYDVCVRKAGNVKVRERGAARTKGAALELEATARRKLMAGAFVVGRSPFFVDFAGEFQSVYAAANNKPSERAAKEMILRKHLVPHFGSLRLDAIGAQHIEAYKAAKLGASLSPKTVNNHLICLAKLFAVAKEWGRLADPPRVKRMKAELPSFDFLSQAEAAKLLAVTDSPWSAMAILALLAGLRISELVALRWEDVNLIGAKVLVRRSAWNGEVGTPKGGKAKEVPLAMPAERALRDLPSRFVGGLVFPATDKDEMFSREACHRPLKRLCKLAGVRVVSWHVLRHTFASHLAMAGVPLKAIQELLRHESIAMTLRYAHLSPGIGANAVDLLYLAPPAEDTRVTKGSRA